MLIIMIIMIKNNIGILRLGCSFIQVTTKLPTVVVIDAVSLASNVTIYYQ